MIVDSLQPRGIVLLVDDSPESLGALIDALEDSGLTALVARDGASAIALLDRVDPDLILLDAIMPGLDGFDTCRKIKARPEMATTPVFFMTGLSDSQDVLRGLQAGGVDYVTKPIKPDEIIARIMVHIANARMITEARSALDAGDHGVVAFKPSGAIAWTSPRAGELISIADESLDREQQAQLLDWLRRAAELPVSGSRDLELDVPGGSGIRISLIGRSAAGDILARVRSSKGLEPAKVLSEALGISAREGEVLAWLANGKSNRDIAAILQLSPRTVTKHVEQIFLKLGVENRTAAAAIALGHLFHSGTQ